MKTRRWVTWLIFGICALAVLEGLGWVTWKALRLERAESEARAQTAFQSRIRLALWRMESEITPIVAQEAARPYFHYQPFYAAERAYTKMLQVCAPDEVRLPSPLLQGTGPYMRVHYQIGPDGLITSPQAPTGNLRDLAESQYVDAEYIVLAGERLRELGELIRRPDGEEGRKDQRVADGPRAMAEGWQDSAPPPPPISPPAPPKREADRLESGQVASQGHVPVQSVQSFEQSEYGLRQQAAQLASAANSTGVPEQQRRSGAAFARKKGLPDEATPSAGMALNIEGPAPAPSAAPATETAARALDKTDGAAANEKEMKLAEPRFRELVKTVPEGIAAEPAAAAASVELGAMEPLWRTSAAGEPELLLHRTVRVGGAGWEQGIWMDWPALRSRLLEITRDLVPEARLSPVAEPHQADAELDRMLASIPVLLVPGSAPAPVPEPLLSPAHLTLLVTWLAATAGVVAIGVVLRTSMELSDRRGRFVSAVTHELRTPLTTFRLYTGMLARGMVREEETRREYLGTLEAESGRLAGIVENVLEYARLERRRAAASGPAGVRELVAQVMPSLERAAARCGMELVVRADVPAEARVRADAPTVERVLLNLVDNACKYANGARDRRIHLEVSIAPRALWGPVAEFLVRDHGPGIPRAERRKIFRAFHRARREDEGTQPGLGLGLALSRGLARQLGGELELGREGEGAELRLTLPLAARTGT